MKNVDSSRSGLVCATGGRFKRMNFMKFGPSAFFNVFFFLLFSRVKTPRTARPGAYDSVDAGTVWSGRAVSRSEPRSDTIRRRNNFITRRVRPACACSRPLRWRRIVLIAGVLSSSAASKPSCGLTGRDVVVGAR